MPRQQSAEAYNQPWETKHILWKIGIYCGPTQPFDLIVFCVQIHSLTNILLCYTQPVVTNKRVSLCACSSWDSRKIAGFKLSGLIQSLTTF